MRQMNLKKHVMEIISKTSMIELIITELKHIYNELTSSVEKYQNLLIEIACYKDDELLEFLNKHIHACPY